MPSRNKAGCGCCDGGEVCDILSDDFNRADDTDIGADWTEISGAWEIASNQLFGNGMVLTTASAPSGQSSHVSIRVKAGGTAYLYVAANSGGTAYIRARFISGFGGSIQLSDHTGSVNSKSVATTDGSWYTFTLCYNESTGWATASVSDQYVSKTYSSGSFGDHAGVGATTDHEFDDFAWSDVTEECEHCAAFADCGCCENGGGEYYDVTCLATYATRACEGGECETLPTTVRVENTTGCTWIYVEEFCDYPIPDCPSWSHSARMTIFDECNLRVLMRIGAESASGSCFDDIISLAEAVYEGTGDGFFAGDCSGPYTLDLISSTEQDSNNSGTEPPCTPTWPATITVERVD